MLLELFPFVTLNNAMALIYAYFLSNKHCLLSLFFNFIKLANTFISATNPFNKNIRDRGQFCESYFSL